MNDKPNQIVCESHGSSPATYVCQHLVIDPVQRWHCALPSIENPRPDAWCDACETVFLRDGEWNDKNEGEVEISILCGHCYDRKLGDSVGRLEGDALGAWRAFVDECQRQLRRKQEDLSRLYSLWAHKRWDWNQERGEIVFSNDGLPAVIAKVAFVGSVSSKSETWLWSWANQHVLDAARARVVEVRDFGEKRDFPHLIVPKWAATEIDGWEMTAVAAHVLGADGAYRTPKEAGLTFMTLSEVRRAQ
jgi:hypothetical protein